MLRNSTITAYHKAAKTLITLKVHQNRVASTACGLVDELARNNDDKKVPAPDLKKRARQFLTYLSAHNNRELALQMMYYDDDDVVGYDDEQSVEGVGGYHILQSAEVLRAQLEHASKLGRYNYQRAKMFQEGNAVLDHTVDELRVLDEADETISNKKKKEELLCKEGPLPKTLKEALEPSLQARVITELCTPFRITSVNSAWEELCGYSRSECEGESLSMIQGPETDQSAVTAMLNQLMKGEECGLVLTNYKKDGSTFRNRLRVAPLIDDVSGMITHFVGVLRDVSYLENEQQLNVA